MSRNLLLYLLPLGLLAAGLYLGFFGNWADDQERDFPPLEAQGQSDSVDGQDSRSYPAGSRGSPEGGDERVIREFVPDLRGRDALKRDGPVPDEDNLDEDSDYQLIYQALRSPEPEERAFALSKLGSDSQILLACLEALREPDKEMRKGAVLALETLEDPYATSVLERVARLDPSQEVRTVASEVLERRTDP